MLIKFVRLFSFFIVVLALIIVGSRSSSAQVAGGSQAAISVPSRIVAPIDESVRTMITGSVHPMAQPQFDVGPVDNATVFNRMILVLGASPEQEYQTRTLLDSQQTQGSPDYHQWLTPEEFGAKFGPSPQDLQQVTGWLQQHGFAVASVAKSGRWIEFSGTSAQVETAFQTHMRQYVVNGENHIANAGQISIPAALSPVVKGVLSLHNFYSKPMLVRSPRTVTATVTGVGGTPHITFSDGSHGIVPGDFATIYDLNKLYNTAINGTGQTIAIVAASNISLTDVSTFRSLFGLPSNQPNIILNGPDPGIDFSIGIGAEATLDTEWSGAVAPNATIDVVVSGGTLTTDPVVLGAAYVINQNLAEVMNVSFGDCEAAIGTENGFWLQAWQQAAAQGISAFVSTGDTGAAGCDPNAPSIAPAQGGVGISGFASTPFNTAVGGTEFNETVNGGMASTYWSPTSNPSTLASAIGYIPEMVWNESCSPTQAGSVCAPPNDVFLFFSGGGGVSGLYPTPSYQTLAITGLSTLNNFVVPGTSAHPRGIPDVSLTAAAINDPYVFCFSIPGTPDCQNNGGPIAFHNLAGGTSFSSPSFAGIMALVDQKRSGRQGLANYVLYPLAASENFSNCNSSSRTNPATGTSCVFNDTTVGNNGVPGNDITNFPTAGALGFPSTAGYDLASGLGSVDAFNLVTAWGNVTFQGSVTTLVSNPTTISITHGTPITFTVGVTKAPTGAGPTGNVAIVTNQAAPGGGTFAVGAGALTGGGFSGSFNDLPGGTYNVTANYPGDGTFAGSVSNIIAATVAPEGSSVSERSLVLNLTNGALTNGNTVAYGDPLNILAVDANTVGASGLIPASGNVTFSIDSSAITPILIDNSGIGEYLDCIFPSTTCLTLGTHTFVATYAGDGQSYNASAASSSISVTITKGNPTPVVVAPAASEPSGVAFTLQAQIGTGLGTIVPTGTVQFFDSSTALGTPVTLSNGTASMQATLNSGGNHNLTVQYSGDATYNSATSGITVVNVTTPFNLTSSSSTQIIAVGGTATFNVSLNGVGGFTGQVSLACSGAPGGSTCTISPNPANLSAGTPSVALTVTVTNTANAHLTTPPLWKQLPFAFAGVLGIAMVSLRRKPRRRLLLLMAVFLVVSAVSCGGGGSTPLPPTNATLTVTGTNNGLSSSITLSLTVTH